MTISRLHTFVSGEVPTAAEWNADIDQLIATLNSGLDSASIVLSGATGMMDLSSAQTASGRKTFTGGVIINEILSVAAAAAGLIKLGEFRYDPASGTSTDNDGFYISYNGDDDTATPVETEYARHGVRFTDTGAASCDGELFWGVVTAGTLATELWLNGAALYPHTNDGLALGTTALGFSDLFLATGAVINWANGEVTLTETDANTLTVAGMSALALGASSVTAGSILANSNDVGALGASGTAWADLFLASGAVINFAAGDITITHASNVLALAGASSGYTFDAPIYLGDTSNTDVTLGITINQGAADNAAFALKSSDVAHGVTTKLETDTYFTLGKAVAASGGVYMQAISGGSAVNALVFDVVTGADSTGKSNTTANSQVQFNCYKISGTGYTSPGANANLFGINDLTAGYTRWLLDVEGDMYSDGSNNVYDSSEGEALDDVALLSTFDKVMADSGAMGLVEQEFEDFLRYDEEMLIKLKVLGGPRANVPVKGRGMINWTALSRLQVGAIRQLGRTINQQQDRINQLESKLMLLTERN